MYLIVMVTDSVLLSIGVIFGKMASIPDKGLLSNTRCW